MPRRAAAKTAASRAGRVPDAGKLVALVALTGALGCQWLGPSSTTAPPPMAVASPGEFSRSDHQGPLGEADGAIPDGTTVFDGDVPGVAKLAPALLAALRRAARDANGEGITFVVNSGWRSTAYQERLLDEAVATYGSLREAERWVATPERSAHVSGGAVDLDPSAATWLSAHGAKYGLCPIYRNEPWHYELRPDAARGCPRMYADPAHDPRMQQ